MAIPPGPGTSAGPEAVPTCYRHPGRETYVSCVRCGRPACPDCLRSAAVGQQCVECIRAGNRTVRAPRGMFGGGVARGAVVTWTLVALNVGFYIVELAYKPLVDNWLLAGYYVAHGEVYRLLTSAFLHEPLGSGIGPLHIIFNMWALIVVGPALEQVLGRLRYLAVYLVSALGGSVLFYLLQSPFAGALGASGAIFGLFGAWFVMSRRLRVDSRQVIMLIVLNLGISFLWSGIAWQAHVGGLLAGGLLTAAYVYAPRPSRALLQVAATVAMVALLVLGVVVRDHQLVGTVQL
jgi:membrane associated rhomboid family serine protease